MDINDKITLNDNDMGKISGGFKQEDEKKEEPKRTLHAGDCYEIKDTVMTVIQIKVLNEYIDIPALSSIIKVDMKRIYLEKMIVLNEYLNTDFPIIHSYLDPNNYKGNNVW